MGRSAVRRIWSRARASEYVIGFALLPASSSGQIMTFATIYRQVATRPQVQQVINQNRCRIPYSLSAQYRSRQSENLLVSGIPCQVLPERCWRGFQETSTKKCYYRFQSSHDVILPGTSPGKRFPRRLYGVPPRLVGETFHRDLGL